jgi:hypothetical protein
MGAEAVEIAARRQTNPSSLRRLVDGDLNWITTKALEKVRERRYGFHCEVYKVQGAGRVEALS